MKNQATWLVLAVSVAVAGAGCISSHRTVYEDAPRQPVEFESETAGRLFYERLSEMTAMKSSESKTEVSIPVVLDVSKTTRRSHSLAFNEAVRLCDTNQDGRITETEARIFREQHSEQ
jgi:hypothetical protein